MAFSWAAQAMTPTRLRTRDQWLLAISGVLPLFGIIDDPLQVNHLIYTLFVLVYFMRGQFARLIDRLPFPPLLIFAIVCFSGGLLSETLVWISNTAAEMEGFGFYDAYPAHITHYIGFYTVVAAAWALTLRRWSFTIAQVFFTAGVFGILIEQRGVIFLSFFQNPLLGLLNWLYVLPIYGSYPALAYALIVHRRWPIPKRDTRWKYAAAVAFLFGLIVLVSLPEIAAGG
jgi:hypothetical protein